MSRTYRKNPNNNYSFSSKGVQEFLINHYGSIKKAKAILRSDAGNFKYLDSKGLKRTSARKIRASQRTEIYNVIFKGKEYNLSSDSKIQTDPWGFD